MKKLLTFLFILALGTAFAAESFDRYGDVTNNGEVTAYDASWTLQHTVGLRTLTGEDSTAADVSGRAGISAFDASLILQYVVDKISVFPVVEGGIPDPMSKSLMAVRNISVGNVVSRADGGFSVPILIDEMANVVAGEVALSFSGGLGDVSVEGAELTSDYLLASNVEDGRIRASFAGAESGVGPGPVLEVVFDASSMDLLSSLRLDRVVLNEGRIPARVDRSTVDVPKAHHLAQNYPNPFNPETTIRYDLAKAGKVRLIVYALNGQAVRTLVDEKRPAGRYSVAWDGRDDAGRAVASGVYLCRMAAGDYRMVRKLVLVR